MTAAPTAAPKPSKWAIVKEWTPHALSAFALTVSIWAAYYARATSPYYYAAPDELTYHLIESNRLTEDDRPLSGTLRVIIKNEADTPAREVSVVLRPMSAAPDITCSVEKTVADGIDGRKIVRLHRIPAGGSAEIRMVDRVTEYPIQFRVFTSGVVYKYCGSVQSVKTELGEVGVDQEQYESYFDPPPNADDPPRKRELEWR
ncbi:hypothetical protein [Alienimonas chondri]|uniref:Uncharacterized protein n=1 Tax=Alienimonas chondri TaxID=2681879 RepID=A0ABX1VHB9_9PLAN|nr:hypothetical protein [Alienimonas chondri]NNJ27549.1 hypothetical protein [Alienimonas chondri]